jgi:hypothetical protein
LRILGAIKYTLFVQYHVDNITQQIPLPFHFSKRSFRKILKILTHTGTAFIVEISETVEAFPAAAAVLELALAGLCESALGHDACTHSFVASDHSHYKLSYTHKEYRPQGNYKSHLN